MVSAIGTLCASNASAQVRTIGFLQPIDDFKPAPPMIAHFSDIVDSNPITIMRFFQTGTETDRCGRDTLVIRDKRYYDRIQEGERFTVSQGGRWDGGGKFLIRKGQSAAVYTGNREFNWFCNSTRHNESDMERTNANHGTNWVLVSRSSSGDKITFRTFSIICTTSDFRFGSGAACTNLSRAPFNERERSAPDHFPFR